MAGTINGQHLESQTHRIWTHIKVLYILCILLSAVVLALFIVCFMMVLEVQQGLNSEVSTRKGRENLFLRSVFNYDEETGAPKAASQKSAENYIEMDSQIHVTKDGGTEIKMNSAALTRFCVSIHSHCPSRGPPGPSGLPGFSVKGDQGIVGLRGYPGAQGVSGPPGPQGPKGEIGAPGYGIPGIVGPEGQKGVKGSAGDEGDMGPMGLRGDKGIGMKGEQGRKGDRGLTGTNGLPGLTGSIGPKGDKGGRGVTGDKGMVGEHGAKGIAGFPGANGPAGEQGPRGKRGKPGVKGDPGEVQQCECHVGPPGPKGDSVECKGTTPSFVLYQNTTIPARSKDATISRIGKPVLYVNTENEWGGWMVDSDPTPTTVGKFYVTQHFTGSSLYQYNSYADLVAKRPGKTYVLQDLYYGTNGVVYRGAFFYHRAGLNQLGRFDLEFQGLNAQLNIDNSLHQGSTSLFNTEYNFYDLTVDGNGLWVLYAYKPDGNEHAVSDTLIVAKLDPNYLTMEKTWNITVNRLSYANAFIVEGIVYLLESGTKAESSISYAYDLYELKERPVNIKFLNVFGSTKMLGYDNLKRALMVYDNGRILSIPLLTANVN